jgi:hypothetical protein
MTDDTAEPEVTETAAPDTVNNIIEPTWQNYTSEIEHFLSNPAFIKDEVENKLAAAEAFVSLLKYTSAEDYAEYKTKLDNIKTQLGI